ncbi:aldehyde dehydrogenase family protein, partial [Alteromonas sp. MCA-1]
MSLPTYQNFIHGKPMANKSKETFAVTNPATGEVIYHVEVADEFIQQEAIKSAKEGFSVWSAMMPIERTRILNKAVALLRERNDELAKLEVLDTG